MRLPSMFLNLLRLRPRALSVVRSNSLCLLIRIALVSTLASPGVTYSQQTLESIEIPTNDCPVMKEFFADLHAEFVNKNRLEDFVSKPLIDKLVSYRLDAIESFFKCFGFSTVALKPKDRDLGIVRRIAATIHIATLKMRVSTSLDPLEVGAFVFLHVSQHGDGSLTARGQYQIEPR